MVFLEGGKKYVKYGERGSNLMPAKDEVGSYEKGKSSGYPGGLNRICLRGVTMRPRTWPSRRRQTSERAQRQIFLCSIYWDHVLPEGDRPAIGVDAERTAKTTERRR
jgi:hypothetical protein